MKKTVKRRKFLRINNPIAFGVLCGLVVLAIGGAAYGLGAGVIAPVVKTISTAKTQQQTYEATQAATQETVEVPESTEAAEQSSVTVEETVTPEPTQEPEVTPTPEPTAEPTAEPTQEPVTGTDPSTVSGEDQGPVGGDGRLSGHIIAIDAAKSSSGKYKGYVSKTPEYQINFNMAQALKEALEAEGATVIMTRSAVDEKPSEDTRVKTVNESGAELTVSVMCNTVSSHDIRGAQVIVSTKKDTKECKKLATAVLSGYKDYTDMPIRGDNGGIRTSSDWGLINRLKKPACLLILGHISNKEDDTNLNDSTFLARGAQGIVNGIIDYLNGD